MALKSFIKPSHSFKFFKFFKSFKFFNLRKLRRSPKARRVLKSFQTLRLSLLLSLVFFFVVFLNSHRFSDFLLLLPILALLPMGSYLSSETPPSQVKAQIDQLRKDSNSHREKAREYSEDSQTAYKSGRHKEAKDFSLKSKEEHRLADQTAEQAAELTFKINNEKLPEDFIDLHGLTVQEALKRVDERLEKERKIGSDHLVVIVGIGNHSVNGIAKIKPAVEELLKKHQVNFEMNRPNDGCVYVKFDGYQAGWWQTLATWWGYCVIS